MGSHGGGYADVELKRAIESGLVKGPRLLTAGPIIASRVPETGISRWNSRRWNRTRSQMDRGTARGVREHAHYGVDHIKMHTTGPFYFKPNGEMVNMALLTLEEIKAVVDEAHRLGMFVANHTYGGDGLKWAIEAGVDDIQHAIAADEADIKSSSRNICPSPQPFWTSARMNRET